MARAEAGLSYCQTGTARTLLIARATALSCPVDHCQAGCAFEFASVGGDQGIAGAARLGGDQNVIRTDRRAEPLEVGADVGGMLRVVLPQCRKVGSCYPADRITGGIHDGVTLGGALLVSKSVSAACKGLLGSVTGFPAATPSRGSAAI